MEFDEFFTALHSTPENCITPFPWQRRLAAQVATDGWGENLVLDLPTGTGKTAAIDIAVYHLIRQAIDGIDERTAPLRIFYVVDRRIVVDAAYRRARRLATTLRSAKDGVLHQAAAALRHRFGLSHDEDPLHAAIMRGGMFRSDGWARSPVQPTICVSTVDQVGSRLLFRGYGVTPSMRPVHAALVGTDSLLLIDEAHLSEPFLQTLKSVQFYGGKKWAEQALAEPITVVRMSATSGCDDPAFRLDEDDRRHELLAKRLNASRPADLEKPVRVDNGEQKKADAQFATRAAAAARDLSNEIGIEKAPVVGVVLNRVRAARVAYEKLEQEAGEGEERRYDVILLTGRIRPFDRDELLFRDSVQDGRGWLRLMEAGRESAPTRPLFVVATQTIEVGADLDFDGLVTEAAPIDALRQRFGRLNRLGSRKHARAIVLVRGPVKTANADDPVYGNALLQTWKWLDDVAEKRGRQKIVDFGLDPMDAKLKDVDPNALEEMLTPRDSAPVMLPAHVDLWCQTNPAPAADPDVAVFLHGPQSRPADVNVVWRADLLEREEELQPGDIQRYVDGVSQIPPTSQEACAVPLHAVRAWLRRADGSEDVTDLEGGQAPEERRSRERPAGRRALRWQGQDDSEVVSPDRVRPGDTIIVPCSYGGYDRFGWNPPSNERDDASPVTDVAESCSRWGRGRPVLRLDPRVARAWRWRKPEEAEAHDPHVAGLLDSLRDSVVDRVPSAEEIQSILDAIAADASTPPAIRKSAEDLHGARVERWLLATRRRLSPEKILSEIGGGESATDLEDATTTDDEGAFGGSRRTLAEHTEGVLDVLGAFLRALPIPGERTRDLEVAARWHDVGKLGERFQKMLFEDEIDWAVAIEPLAKSGIPAWQRNRRRRAREAAGVPVGFRHEAFSVQLVSHDRFRDATLSTANDANLVRFLIGTHHGWGRPFHTVVFDDKPPAVEQEFDGVTFELAANERAALVPLHHLAAEWPDLFWRLVRRYGYWGLAWLETVLRLADQRQSALEEREDTVSAVEVTA